MSSTSLPDFSGVTQLLQLYFDGLYTSDAKILAEVFHPHALYCSAVEGEVVLRNMEDYLPLVAARASPDSRKEQRNDHIENIEFAGASVASARVRCRIGERHFVDFLSLIHTGDAWKIIAKVFHFTHHPSAQSEN